MTRINLVNPRELTDKHLMAEYHELPRIFTQVGKLLDKYAMNLSTRDQYCYGSKLFILPKLPEEYVLGKGHCKFFYNKLNFLYQRYQDIYGELRLRGYKLDLDKYRVKLSTFRDIMSGTSNNQIKWSPSPAEIYLNMQRITERHFEEK